MRCSIRGRFRDSEGRRRKGGGETVLLIIVPGKEKKTHIIFRDAKISRKGGRERKWGPKHYSHCRSRKKGGGTTGKRARRALIVQSRSRGPPRRKRGRRPHGKAPALVHLIGAVLGSGRGPKREEEKKGGGPPMLPALAYTKRRKRTLRTPLKLGKRKKTQGKGEKKKGKAPLPLTRKKKKKYRSRRSALRSRGRGERIAREGGKEGGKRDSFLRRH